MSRRVEFTLRPGSGATRCDVPVPHGLLCGVSLESAGDMALSRRGVLPCRAGLFSSLGVSEDSVFALRQVHSRRIVVVADQLPHELVGIEADGMLTLRQDALLTVTVADCLPIVLVDTKGDGFGIVHSGWKGTGIAAEAVRIMHEKLGALPQNLSVTIGPGIGACCYRVPRERAESFEAEFGPGSVVYGQDGTPRRPAGGQYCSSGKGRRGQHRRRDRLHGVHARPGILPPPGGRALHPHARLCRGGTAFRNRVPGGEMFSIRRMTTADKPAIMEISSHIWEGSDYLPAVFDERVADREGEFAAVLMGERLVGCGKLTFLTGRRVDGAAGPADEAMVRGALAFKLGAGGRFSRLPPAPRSAFGL